MRGNTALDVFHCNIVGDPPTYYTASSGARSFNDAFRRASKPHRRAKNGPTSDTMDVPISTQNPAHARRTSTPASEPCLSRAGPKTCPRIQKQSIATGRAPTPHPQMFTQTKTSRARVAVSLKPTTERAFCNIFAIRQVLGAIFGRAVAPTRSCTH